MLRLGISVLAALGLLAGQLAAVPHVHGGVFLSDEHQHDGTPHFHIHGHADHGHCHVPANLPGPSIEDHDVTSICVSVSSAVTSATSSGRFGPTSPELLAIEPLQDGLETIWLLPISSAAWHPPDATADGGDIYLTLRNLRI